MKNIIFVISTLQESDSFFSFAAALKDRNKNIKIITIIDSANFYEQLKKNRSLLSGFKKLGLLLYIKKNKYKILQKLYNFFYLLKLCFIIIKLDKPILFAGGNFNNIYRISFQFFCIRKNGKVFFLMPHSFLWHHQYKEFKNRAVNTIKNLKGNLWHKILSIKRSGFIYYNNKQIGFAKLVQNNLKFSLKQICSSGLGSETNYYVSFFNSEYKKIKKKLHFLKNKKLKNIYTIICSLHGNYLLKKDSEKRVLKLIIYEIFKYNKDSIILLRKHPKDNSNKSQVSDIVKELKIKKNILFTNLHPHLLAKISSRIIFYARTNVSTDIFRSKMIDCSEYKKEDLNRNNGQSPGNYGHGVIYINPKKRNFKEIFRKVLTKNKFFLNKKVYKEEEKLLKQNKFDYKKVEEFINTNN